MKNKISSAFAAAAVVLALIAIFAAPGRPQGQNFGAGTSGIVLVPGTTAANLIAPTANGVVGLTIIPTTGTGSPDIFDVCSLAACGTKYLNVGANGVVNSSVSFSAPILQAATSIKNGNTGSIVWSSVNPTIASGFGSSPSVPNANGTSAFTINVGTGGTASTGVVTMPTANAGWSCAAAPNGAPPAAAVTYSAPTSVSSITLTNYTLTTGVPLAWSSGEVLQVGCWAY